MFVARRNVAQIEQIIVPTRQPFTSPAIPRIKRAVCDRIYDIILERCHVIIFNFPLLSGAENFLLPHFHVFRPQFLAFLLGKFSKPQHVINHLGWCRKPLAIKTKKNPKNRESERLKVGRSSSSSPMRSNICIFHCQALISPSFASDN
jgi:hypothetical protein